MASSPDSMSKRWIPGEQWKCICPCRKKFIIFGSCCVLALVVLAIVLGVTLGVKSKKRGDSPSHDHLITFYDNYNVTWSADHLQVLDNGLVANVLLDNSSGSEFGSIKSYLYGHLSMQIKLVANDSAGTVTAFYMASQTKNRDEFDFEFLGNRSGQPYVLQTNVYVNGTGDREQRIFLWFDPTLDYHKYSVLWNQYQVIFFVDDMPVRVFRNNTVLGVSYAYNQALRVFGSMWNGEQWATVGGLEKTNWSFAPFVASFKDFVIDGCVPTVTSSCQQGNNWWDVPKYQFLNLDQLQNLSWVKKNYLIYDYCTDTKRFSPLPPECGSNP